MTHSSTATSVPRPRPNQLQGKPKAQTFPDKVWGMLACFRSIHLAIVLIALLALATLAGVLLPQEGIVDALEIKRNAGANYRMFKAMGLYTVYSSYWFIALEVLFFLNLLCGSFQWLKPAFLAATRKTFCGPEHIQTSPHKLLYQTTEPIGAAVGQVNQLLKRHHYKIHKPINAKQRPDGAILLYASKGNWSRFGPVVAHLGILLMLIASVYGAFFGFKAQKLAVPGETFAIQDSQMFRPNVNPSLWQGSVPDWKIRVNDFRMEYYPEGTAAENVQPGQNPVVKQYFGDLSVIDKNGHTTKREVISVNHPLTVDDTVLYQASFNPTGKLFVSVNGKLRKLDTNTQFMNRPVSLSELGNGRALMVFPFFVQQDLNVTRNYVVIFLRDAHGFVGAKPGKMPPNLRLREGESGELSGIRFTYVKPEFATGLQIKKGPEVPWMYLAYAIIILGAFMCIFSQRRLWIAILPGSESNEQPTTRLMLQYKTNKARLSFMKELQNLQNELIAGLRVQSLPADATVNRDSEQTLQSQPVPTSMCNT